MSKLGDFTPDARNANKGTARGQKMIVSSIQQNGFGRSVLADKNGVLIAGNKTVEASAEVFGVEVEPIVIETDGQRPIVVKRTDLDLNDPNPNSPARRLAYQDNLTSRFSFELDPAVVMADIEAGFNFEAIDISLPDLGEMLGKAARELLNGQSGRDVEPQIDKADELRQKWGTALGQVWQLGNHRLACGDCTERAVVEAVMRGERAVLCHADPPYGMGKENEGIANDNLYREKLDAFQMQWWGVGRPHLEDNASAYIWGNADDLWRLWYCGGLRNSERLTFRNEIVWDKGNGQGIGSEDFRSYAPTTERCLFFMLGEQGFNNNADNYWEGFEPIRSYLDDERQKMGWDNKTIADWFGFHPRMADHWLSKSQWSFPLREQYEKLQQAANGQAFKRDYDTLKRDYYATRAYFDNTHENMTDVWQFPRVQGDDRWGHATPKPAEMIMRIVKSSSSEGAIVYSPFLGSGTDLIACENLGRKCRAIELDPGYVAVALQRWADLTGQTPKLSTDTTPIKNG